MDDQHNAIDVGFTKENPPESCHVCLIFDKDEQRQSFVSEYLAAGLRKGELVRCLVDTTSPEQIRASLVELGVEVPEDSPFTISKAEDFYCPNGQFDPQKLIDAMEPRYNSLQKAGYPGIRSCGEMSWVLRGVPGSDRLLEYETLLSTVTGTFPHSGMCIYDARLFDGATLFKVLQLHPYMIAQGQIVRNPYYVRPEEFLKGLTSSPS